MKRSTSNSSHIWRRSTTTGGKFAGFIKVFVRWGIQCTARDWNLNSLRCKMWKILPFPNIQENAKLSSRVLTPLTAIMHKLVNCYNMLHFQIKSVLSFLVTLVALHLTRIGGSELRDCWPCSLSHYGIPSGEYCSDIPMNNFSLGWQFSTNFQLWNFMNIFWEMTALCLFSVHNYTVWINRLWFFQKL